MARPKTKTKAQSVGDYIRKTYKRIETQVPKAKAAIFIETCKANNTNPNRLINQWIDEYIKTPLE